MSTIILILMILLILKAIFSAADVSFPYMNKNEMNQLAKKKNRKAIQIKKMLDHPNRFFGTVRVALTLLEFLMSAFVLEFFLDRLKEFMAHHFNGIMVHSTFFTILSIFILTFAFSYITIILGELLPKKIARAYPKKITFGIVGILTIVSKVIYPFEILLNITLKALMKVLHIKDKKEEKMTEKELKMIIAEGRAEGVINEESKKLLLNTLKFKSYKIKDVFISKDQVDFLDANASMEQIIHNFKKYNYTRVPVYQGDSNHIIGILNMKDFIFTIDDKVRKKLDLHKMLRPAFFIHKEEKMDDVFRTMQLNSYSMAIVLGENSVVEGIVTMEDIIEKIVGDIFDEFDKKDGRGKVE